MNLGQFIQHRIRCPLCDTELTTGFHSHRKQVLRYEGTDRLSILFELKGMRSGEPIHKVAYSFNLFDNSFCIEFYSNEGMLIDSVFPIYLINQFRELHKNLRAFKFYRNCSFCRRYSYNSNTFNIDMTSGIMNPLEVWTEQFAFSQVMETYIREYTLNNFLTENRSDLIVFRGESLYHNLDSTNSSNSMILQLPLIPFISEKKTLDRLNKLVVFS